jgi:hypothetical protein
MNEEEISKLHLGLARGFWSAFEYDSPRRADDGKFVLQWFDSNGYQIKRKSEND